MKHTRTLRRALWPVAVGCLVGATAVRAQSERETASAPPSPTVKEEMIRIIQIEGAKLPAAPVLVTPPARVGAVSAVDMIAPVIVRGERLPDLRFYRETRSERFFRTGTFSRQVGPRVTTRCWARGDAGVMVSFNW